MDFWAVIRGRNACSVANGARRRAFRVSNQVCGEIEQIGFAGRDGPGTKMTAVRWRV